MQNDLLTPALAVRSPPPKIEAAALSAYKWMGKGDKESADFAACDAIRGLFDTVAISIANTNRPPVWAARADTSTDEQVSLVFTVSASDPDAGDAGDAADGD